MKKVLLVFALSFQVVLWVGCSNPADSVPAASVSADSSNATEPAKSPEVAEARLYVFSGDNSKIQFKGSKVTGSHDGGFNKFEGEIRVVNGRVADTGNKVVIDTTSLWSDNNRLTGHLKSPDFFDAEKHPTAVFETVSVTGEPANSTVTGNLTLHGITKKISFPARIEVKEDAVTLAAEFSINRFDFEMKYAGKADDLIRPEVVLKLDVTAQPKQG